MQKYQDLKVWQKSITLVLKIYKLTSQFPREEVYGLSSQMKRAAISIPCNISEGKSRQSGAEFRRFLLIAFGSGAELETQLEITKLLFKTDIDSYNETKNILTEIMKMLNKLISNLTS